MAKINLPRSPNLSDESRLYENIRLKNTPLESSGPFSVTSESSGNTYSTTNGGEIDVLSQLDNTIGTSLVSSDDINDINKVHVPVINGRVLEFTIPSWANDSNRPFRIELPISIGLGTVIQVQINGDPILDLKDDVGSDVLELSNGYYTFIFKDDIIDFFLIDPFTRFLEWNGARFIVNSGTGRLFCCGFLANLTYELDVNTKLQLNSVASPSGNPTGIGGLTSRLYLCDQGADGIYELDINTRVPINSIFLLSSNPTGIGGTNTRLYFINQTFGSTTLQELDPNTLLGLSSIPAQTTSPIGIGGTNNRLYYSDITTDLLYELDLNTKEILSQAVAPSNAPWGIGGFGGRLYHADRDAQLIYELDRNTKMSIGSAPSPSIIPSGTGGFLVSSGLSITHILFENVAYELTDDSPFRIGGNF